MNSGIKDRVKFKYYFVINNNRIRVGKINMGIERGGLKLSSASAEEILHKLKESKGFAPIIAEKATQEEGIRRVVIEAMEKYIKEENGPERAAIEKMLLELQIIEFLEALKK